jgi:hypothetical protein
MNKDSSSKSGDGLESKDQCLVRSMKSSAGCLFFSAAQEMPRFQLEQRSWRPLPVANALNANEVEMQGSIRNKFNMKETVSAQAKMDLKAGIPPAPYERNERVWIQSMYHPHTCEAFTAAAGAATRQPSKANGKSRKGGHDGSVGGEGGDEEDDDDDDDGPEDDDDDDDDATFATAGSSSTNPGVSGGFTARELANSLLKDCSGRRVDVRTQSLKDIQVFLETRHGVFHNLSKAKQVRRLLTQSSDVDTDAELQLLQGAVHFAEQQGHYAKLLHADASEVLAQLRALQKSRYYAKKKASLQGDAEVPRFDETKAGPLPEYPDRDAKGNKITYVIGWYIAPSYMRASLGKFVPVSAMDVAFAKTQHGGQGSFYLESTVDAEHHIHPIGIMHVLAPENIFGYSLFHAHSLAAYDQSASTGHKRSEVAGNAANAAGVNPLLQEGRVLIADGNVSIPSVLEHARPRSKFVRDIRHLKADFRKHKRVRRVFGQLAQFTPSDKSEAVHILQELQEKDGAAYSLLMSIGPLELWCPAFMPHAGVNTHGHFTSNMVEIMALMIMPMRQSRSLLTSFLTCLAFIRRRYLEIQGLARSCSEQGFGPRTEKVMQDVMATALKRKARIHQQPQSSHACSSFMDCQMTVALQRRCVSNPPPPPIPHPPSPATPTNLIRFAPTQGEDLHARR